MCKIAVVSLQIILSVTLYLKFLESMMCKTVVVPVQIVLSMTLYLSFWKV